MSSTAQSVRVMVTGVGGGGHGEQILKALRLADVDFEIVGSDMSPRSSGLALVDIPCVMPPAGDPSYTETLLGVCRSQGVRALFHGSEPELKVISDNRELFEREGILVPINPREVIEVCMDKARTFEFLDAQGFPVIPYRRLRSIEDAAKFDQLPAVLKPSVGGGGSANMYLVQSREELMTAAAQLLSIYSEAVIQAYVGTPQAEYTVGVLLDMDGNLINSIAMRREILTALSNQIKVPNRSGREDLGPVLALSNGISQGEVGRFEAVTEPCERIALSLGACGPINIQCRLVGGQVLPFEINPRFSGTTSVRAMVGYNEPEVLVRRHLLGEEVEPKFEYRSGWVLRGLSEVLVGDPSFPSARELA